MLKHKKPLVEMLETWMVDWEDMRRSRDNTPPDHPHRQVWEAMCNTQMARVADLCELIKSLPDPA